MTPAVLLAGLAQAFAGDASLRARILDATSRTPVPCVVRLTDSTGRWITNDEGFRDGFRCSGAFTQQVAAGHASLRITRGFEYAAVERELDLRPGEGVDLSIELSRRVDLRSRGWFASDHHAHMLHGERTLPVSFDQVALAARSEDLQALSLAQAWPLETPTPERLEREFQRLSHPDCHLTWNLEAPKNYYRGDAGRCLGHCWNMGLKGRTAEGEDVMALLLQASAWDYESTKPSFANFESHALIHAQGGAVFYTHAARWWTGAWGGQGGYPRRASMRVSNMAVELPLDVLAGPTFDGLDVITGNGESAADEKSFQLWCLLLNHGYRLAATASSDACFDRPGGATPGTARTYTYLGGPFSVGAAARATAQGRTFATTGPLLLLTVDGHPPGTSLPVEARPHRLRLEAWPSGSSTSRLERVELYRDGRLHQRFRIDQTESSWATNLDLTVDGPSWFCARAFGTDARRQRAVTGAVYFESSPWTSPAPVPAVIQARVVDSRTGLPLQATLTEVEFRGPRAHPGRKHPLPSGEGSVTLPATRRLRAEARGYEPQTLSPFFDYPELVREITELDAEALLDWRTYDRVRELLGRVPLTFRLHPLGSSLN